MASSDVDIFSKALLLLRLSAIDSFLAEGADKGKAAFGGEIYEQTKHALIDEYPWRAFMAKAALNRETAGPLNEYTYSFTLPPDIRGGPFAVFNSSSVNSVPVTDGWEVFGDRIYSNHTALWIDYKTDRAESEFPAYFVQLLVYELAWLAAIPLTGDIKKSEFYYAICRGTALEQGKGGYFRIATQADAMSTTPQQFLDFTLIEARAGLGY